MYYIKMIGVSKTRSQIQESLQKVRIYQEESWETGEVKQQNLRKDTYVLPAVSRELFHTSMILSNSIASLMLPKQYESAGKKLVSY